MRTLQIGDTWLPEEEGGLARYYYELIRHLPATGASVHGLVVGSCGAKHMAGCDVAALARQEDSMFTRLRAARHASLVLIDKGQIDLIASHFALYALPIADKLRSIPTVAHFHGPWSGESGAEGSATFNSRMKNIIENVVYSRAKLHIVLTRAFQEELTQRYGISEETIRIVPGGIDIDRFNIKLSRAEAREQMGWPMDRPILLCVRRQVRRMGLENLIDAARILVQQRPDLVILLGGSGPVAGELKQRIAGSGLESNVKQLGRIPDEVLPTAYRAADMTVVPSQSLEGFGLITLESMASGTPVFVTPIGGLPEVLEPFAPQCIFEGTSAAAIADGLGEALRGARPMPSAESCRQYAVDGFSWPRITARVRNVYDEALR
jgi:glycosyltransferase involved in cell wall biosynthesis